MERWKWGKSKIRSFLLLLEVDKMILKKSDSKKTTFFILNYEKFQGMETTYRLRPDRRQTADKLPSDTNNNDNNSNNEKNTETIYKSFLHLSISKSEFETLLSEGFKKSEIDEILDEIQNYKKNKNYSSLLITARSWMKRKRKAF